MIAFVAAMGAEDPIARDVLRAISRPCVFARFRVLVDYCGVIYAVDLQNADDYTSKPSSKPYGIFTPEAELTSGKAGLVGLLRVTIVEKIMGHGFLRKRSTHAFLYILNKSSVLVPITVLAKKCVYLCLLGVSSSSSSLCRRRSSISHRCLGIIVNSRIL